MNWVLESCCERDTGKTKSFDAEVLCALESYTWPGNVRELQNVVRRMCVLAEDCVITMRDLPTEMSQVADRSSGMFVESAAGIECVRTRLRRGKNSISQSVRSIVCEAHSIATRAMFPKPRRPLTSIGRHSTACFASIA